MIRQLILEKVRDAAETLGLPRERVITQSKKDNLTLPRPRVEIQFLPATYLRTGRRLGRTETAETSAVEKKELYQITLPAAAQALADDPAWLRDFVAGLIPALATAFNDHSGNFVRLRCERGEWENEAVQRVGGNFTVIEPLVKRGYLLHLNATYRATAEEAAALINNIQLKIGDLP